MKKILRKKLLVVRKKKYLEISHEQISNIFKLLNKEYKNKVIIGGYAPVNYEYDCLKILNFLETKNFVTCLPKIKNDFQMDFFKYSSKDPLNVNKFGIPEPFNTNNKILPDLIFVPLLGYDNKLNRLGYGGGFYDRYFEKISKIKQVIKIGLAFSFQEIKKLPINKFDKKLDRIITEKKVLI